MIVYSITDKQSLLEAESIYHFCERVKDDTIYAVSLIFKNAYIGLAKDHFRKD